MNNFGLVFSWGINNKGCLGFPQDKDVKTPQLIERDSSEILFDSIKDIACGGTHSMALSEEGRTYSWGNGDNGRLGHNSKRSEALPKEIIALKEVSLVYQNNQTIC